ncbi:MAG: hypothetical protein P8103_16180 [Candidatus Thiodiazotropha sp.]
MLRWLLAMAMFVWVWQAVADEDPACQAKIGLNDHYTPEALLSIAATCRVPEVAELFFNRAHHLRMLEKYERFERSLLHFGDRDHRAYIEAYRIHIGLAEAFATERLQRQDKQALRQLNRIYDESAEIAEMRFRGYDLIADRLERNYQL